MFASQPQAPRWATFSNVPLHRFDILEFVTIEWWPYWTTFRRSQYNQSDFSILEILRHKSLDTNFWDARFTKKRIRINRPNPLPAKGILFLKKYIVRGFLEILTHDLDLPISPLVPMMSQHRSLFPFPKKYKFHASWSHQKCLVGKIFPCFFLQKLVHFLRTYLPLRRTPSCDTPHARLFKLGHHQAAFF